MLKLLNPIQNPQNPESSKKIYSIANWSSRPRAGIRAVLSTKQRLQNRAESLKPSQLFNDKFATQFSRWFAAQSQNTQTWAVPMVQSKMLAYTPHMQGLLQCRYLAVLKQIIVHTTSTGHGQGSPSSARTTSSCAALAYDLNISSHDQCVEHLGLSRFAAQPVDARSTWETRCRHCQHDAS